LTALARSYFSRRPAGMSRVEDVAPLDLAFGSVFSPLPATVLTSLAPLAVLFFSCASGDISLGISFRISLASTGGGGVGASLDWD
jgi:hypothetical protein